VGPLLAAVWRGSDQSSVWREFECSGGNSAGSGGGCGYVGGSGSGSSSSSSSGSDSSRKRSDCVAHLLLRHQCGGPLARPRGCSLAACGRPAALPSAPHNGGRHPWQCCPAGRGCGWWWRNPSARTSKVLRRWQRTSPDITLRSRCVSVAASDRIQSIFARTLQSGMHCVPGDADCLHGAAVKLALHSWLVHSLQPGCCGADPIFKMH